MYFKGVPVIIMILDLTGNILTGPFKIGNNAALQQSGIIFAPALAPAASFLPYKNHGGHVLPFNDTGKEIPPSTFRSVMGTIRGRDRGFYVFLQGIISPELAYEHLLFCPVPERPFCLVQRNRAGEILCAYDEYALFDPSCGIGQPRKSGQRTLVNIVHIALRVQSVDRF